MIWDWIVEKWDLWVYSRSYATFKRMAKRNHGMMYIVELSLRDYNADLSPEVKAAAAAFYETLKDHE